MAKEFVVLRKFKNSLRMRRFGLTQKPAKEGEYSAEIDGQETVLGHSAFQTAWLAEKIANPAVIVELGAFDGGDVNRFHQAFPECRIIAVEADPVRVEIARKNLKNTPIQVVHSAACETDGPIDWFAAEVDGMANAQGSIFRHTESYKKRFPFVDQSTSPDQVDGRRLDSLMQELGVSEIDLLHMDIEGAENAAMRGMGGLRPKMIYLEMREKLFESGASFRDTEQLLESLGYVLVVDLRIDRLYFHKSLI